MESYFGSDQTVKRIWKLIERDVEKMAVKAAQDLVAQGYSQETATDQAWKMKGEYIAHVRATFK